MATNAGRFTNGIFRSCSILVNPLTRPTSYSFGFFFVNKLITRVIEKQISHAHQARQKLAAISLCTLDMVIILSLNQ